MFSSSITNSNNQIRLRAFKELQNTVLKLQSTVSRHFVWAAKRNANSSEWQNFEDLFFHLLLLNYFLFQNRTNKQQKIVQRKDVRMGAEKSVTLKFNAFEVALNRSSSCQYLKNHSCLTLHSIFVGKIKNTDCQGTCMQNCAAKYYFLFFVPSQFPLISLLKFEMMLLFHGSCNLFMW